MAVPDSLSRPRRDVSFLGLDGTETQVLLRVGRGKKPVDKTFLRLGGPAQHTGWVPGRRDEAFLLSLASPYLSHK